MHRLVHQGFIHQSLHTKRLSRAKKNSKIKIIKKFLKIKNLDTENSQWRKLSFHFFKRPQQVYVDNYYPSINNSKTCERTTQRLPIKLNLGCMSSETQKSILAFHNPPRSYVIAWSLSKGHLHRYSIYCSVHLSIHPVIFPP